MPSPSSRVGALAVGLAVACTAPAYFPKEPPPLPDSGRAGGAPSDSGTEGSSPPGELPCSVDAGGTAYLEVVVVGDQPRRLLWIDHACVEVDYGELSPGGLVPFQTTFGHSWVARDSAGGAVAAVVVDEDPEVWEVP